MKNTAAVLILALAAPVTAEPLCFTKSEIRALAAFVTAPMFNAATEQCKAYPGPTPMLTAAAPGLKTRFAAQRAAAIPVVGPKLLEVVGVKNVKPEAVIDAMAPAIGLGLQSSFGKLDAATCGSTDAIAGPLLTLSDSQLTTMIGEILVLATKDNKDKTFRQCNA